MASQIYPPTYNSLVGIPMLGRMLFNESSHILHMERLAKNIIGTRPRTQTRIGVNRKIRRIRYIVRGRHIQCSHKGVKLLLVTSYRAEKIHR